MMRNHTFSYTLQGSFKIYFKGFKPVSWIQARTLLVLSPGLSPVKHGVSIGRERCQPTEHYMNNNLLLTSNFVYSIFFLIEK